MPNVCPRSLIVLAEAEANPKYLFSTEDMIKCVFVAEKSPIPTPTKTNPPIIRYIFVSMSTNADINNPTDINMVPNNANLPESHLSDSLPAIGDIKTLTTV
jgi:hypothetical protein